MAKLLSALKIKPTEKVLTISVIVLLALTVLGGGYAVYSYHGKVSEKSKELDKLNGQIKDAREAASQIDVYINAIDELKPQIEKQKSRVPTFDFKNEYDDLTLLLQQIAKEAGVTVPSVKFDFSNVNKDVPANVSNIGCEIKVGNFTFFSLLKFINLIETSNRFIVIDLPPDTSGGEKAEVSITLKTFTYKGGPPPQYQEKPATGKTTPLPE